MAEKIKPIPPKTLSKGHIECCNMLADPEMPRMTRIAMADKLGVTRRTLYSWLERRDVRDYLNDLISYYTDGELANVWRSLVRTAEKGNVNAMRLYFEMKQLYVPPQQVVDLQMKDATANINIISNIPRPVVGGDDIDD